MKRGDFVRIKGKRRVYVVRATRRNTRGVQIQLRAPGCLIGSTLRKYNAREEWRNGEDYEVVNETNRG